MKELNIKTKWGNVLYWISEEWKEADTLFFMHGMTADHTMFEKQYDYFGEKYNIIAWDAPCHGKSRPFEDFSYKKCAETIRMILAKHEIEDAFFIGQSMGGFIAQAVIKRYPGLVKGFVAIDSTPYGEKYYTKSDKWWLRQIEWMAHLYPLNAMKKAIAKQVSVTEEAYDNMMEMLSVYDKNEICHLMGIAYAGFLEDNCNLAIKCPVLLLLGDKDVTGKVKFYNEEWAKTEGFPLVIIENAAHNSNVDRPDMVNKEIEKFLESA